MIFSENLLTIQPRWSSIYIPAIEKHPSIAAEEAADL
jgi:hypothetical protein